MNNKEKINIYRTIIKIQEIQIRQLKKELSIYRDKYKNISRKYYYENRKNYNKN